MPYSAVSGVIDAQDPRAQRYARMALKKNGIVVPAHVDAARIWRDFSGMRARAQAVARQAGPDAPDLPTPRGTARPVPAYPTGNTAGAGPRSDTPGRVAAQAYVGSRLRGRVF